jgi:hypothetical protein
MNSPSSSDRWSVPFETKPLRLREAHLLACGCGYGLGFHRISALRHEAIHERLEKK